MPLRDNNISIRHDHAATNVNDAVYTRGYKCTDITGTNGRPPASYLARERIPHVF